MKKLLALFSVLVVVFMGVWIFKTKLPGNRPDDENASDDGSDWWVKAEDIPVADSEYVLDRDVPANYIPIPGENELYMVIEDGRIVQYCRRIKQENGTWKWETVNPDIPSEYEPVANKINIYRVKGTDGKYVYYKYIRNDDDTYAFVPVDENGNELDIPDASRIPDNYLPISNNLYAVFNEHGVLIGHKELKKNEKGEYYWVDAQVTALTTTTTTTTTPTTPNPPITTKKPDATTSKTPDVTKPPVTTTTSRPIETLPKPPSTYTQTETITEYQIAGGWRITIQTIFTYTYSSDGTLLSTVKDGPKEVAREKLVDTNGEIPDPSKVANTLQEEYLRVSNGLLYDNSLAQEVLALINEERQAAGNAPLALIPSSDGFYLAAIRAADMAIFDHADIQSPVYGSLSQMCSKFNIEAKSPTEILWKATGDQTAKLIAARLKLFNGNDLTNSTFKAIGLSIVSKNGYYYIDVVLLR